MWQPEPTGCWSRIGLRAVLLSMLVLSGMGCEGPGVPSEVTSGSRPRAGVTLRVACEDPTFARAVDPVIRSWAGRTGSRVELVTGRMAPGDTFDVGLMAPRELGAWADRGDLLPVPSTFQDSNTFRWPEILGPYRDRLARWGNQVFAIPVGGAADVVIYRSDRFQDPNFVARFRERFSREPAPPSTWEEFAGIAEIFQALDGKPSLPAESDEPRRQTDRFFTIAASYNRIAITEVKGLGSAVDVAAALSFQFDIATGKPRLTLPAFETALTRMQQIEACRSKETGSDPVAALVEGRAMLAVINLAEVARLPREKESRFALSRLPGATLDTGKNFVPYYSRGTLGVVRSGCANPEAAFELLMDLGSPERAAELCAVVGTGIGPVRNSELDRAAWLSYGFDPRLTDALAGSVRGSLSPDVTNPAFVLRGPDQQALTDALAKPLADALARKVKPAEALKQAEDAWNALDGPRLTEVRRWRRKAAGLE